MMSSNNKIAFLTIGLLIAMFFIEQQLAQRMNSVAFTLVIGVLAIVLVGIVLAAQRYWRTRE